MDSFVEYEEFQAVDLLAALKENIPDTIHVYSFVRTALEWKKKKSDFNIRLLAPYGDTSDSTFFLSIVSKQEEAGGKGRRQRMDGTAYSSTEKGLERLGRAFMAERLPPLPGWDFLFTSLTGGARENLEAALASIGLPSGVTTCTMFWMPSRQAASITPREASHDGGAVEVRELGQEWVALVNSTWPHRFPGSEALVSTIIRLNYGLGVFKSGRLLSWGLFWFYGGIGVVATLEGEERKGYASLLVESLARRMGQEGLDVHLFVVDGNLKGRRLFEKLGFRPLPSPKYWLHSL